MNQLNPDWTYEKKIIWSEIIYILLATFVIPFFVGIQIWDELSFTFGLIVINILQLPSIILFYRVVLPQTLLRRKYLLFLAVFIPYLLIYEINSRIAALAVIHAPFIPEGYQKLLAQAAPGDFSVNIFNQSFGYTFLLLLTATSVALVKELFKEQKKVYEIAFDKVKLELNHLKSQVQPHFFFNTLNNLYTLSIQKSALAPVMIANLSEIMRYVIYESEQEKVSLEKEINFITKYIDLEKIRHGNQDLIEFVVQGNPDLHQIEPLLFIPLIENCFKHGLIQSKEKEGIRIVLVIEGNELTFQTVNRFDSNFIKSSQVGGIGLSNVRKRLDLLYPNRHSLNIEQNEGYFEVLLCLNLSDDTLHNY